MNAKDQQIEEVQQESEWLALAKSLTRAEAAWLKEQRRQASAHYIQEVRDVEV